ncbi:MAG: hypothetical protein JSV64_08705 [Candidatus Bathyarchaeota archaeon]|jgi:uncharacterized protein YdiU (UPF0061 family)|nr:MAG: hypothetical protein JSV64_08705 [Candidatus Bathyarchaeota archaeon]
MTEEPASDSPMPEKLLIDNPSDFQFHAAYMVYSEIFDRVTESESRKLLNHNIKALQENQMDYAAFYESINQYRSAGSSQDSRYRRSFIKTQKKKEWRRKAQKQERNKRYRR